MDNEKLKELIGANDPGLLLDMNKSKTCSNIRPLISEPVKLVLIIASIDVIYAALASVITGKSYFFGGFIMVPWPLAFLDGIILIGYGIYVKKRKYGELDVSTGYQSGNNEIIIVEGGGSELLAWVYIILGILLFIGTCFSLIGRTQ